MSVRKPKSIAEEAFLAGYSAGHKDGVRKVLKLIWDLGPEVRQAFMDQNPVDADNRPLWDNLKNSRI
jgi:hypothetical protein